ncbi:MAG: M20 family metallopeptidase [Atribacterota bacterium]
MFESQFVTDILKSLIQIPSMNPPGKEAKIAEEVCHMFADMGIKSEIYYLNGGERANVVVILDSGKKGPAFVLNGHLDTVPIKDNWDHEPFMGEIVNGRLYGLGASDMKSGLAAIMVAVNEIKNEIEKLNGTLIVSFVSDEEKNNLGTRDFLNRYKNIDYALIAEPSDLSIVRSNRGTLRFKLTIYGVAGHSSNPANGVNAIYKIVDVINALRDYGNKICRDQNYYMSPSITVTMIDGGTAENTIPDKCEIIVDRRMVYGENKEKVEGEILDILENFAKKDEQFKYSYCATGYMDPWRAKPDSKLIKYCEDAFKNCLLADPNYMDFQGTTEAALFAEKGIDTVIFGPGDLKLAHSKNESVEVEQVMKSSRLLYVLIKKVLSERVN